MCLSIRVPIFVYMFMGIIISTADPVSISIFMLMLVPFTIFIRAEKHRMPCLSSRRAKRSHGACADSGLRNLSKNLHLQNIAQTHAGLRAQAIANRRTRNLAVLTAWRGACTERGLRARSHNLHPLNVARRQCGLRLQVSAIMKSKSQRTKCIARAARRTEAPSKRPTRDSPKSFAYAWWASTTSTRRQGNMKALNA